MGKKDRAAEIAKQSKKKPDELKNPKTKQQIFAEEQTRRENEIKEKARVARETAESARKEQELARSAAQKAGGARIGGERMGGAKTFAKARKQQAQEVESGSESDVSAAQDVPLAPVPVAEPLEHANANCEVPDNNKAKKKAKKAKGQFSDEWESLQSQATEARNARIVQRIKNMLFIGLFEKKREVTVAQDSKRKKKAAGAEKPKGVVGTVRDFKSLLFSLGILLCLIALKIGEEGYDQYNQRDENELNPYTVLEISSSASPSDIKKTYKDQALKWHPDKNPDCETCEKHFGDIGKAYELLSNPTRRAAYDNKKRESNKLESAYSIPLNREEYERKVIRSNDVWIICVHNSDKGSSQGVYSIYEDLAQKGHEHFRFAHVDAAGEGASVIPLLPVRKGVYPVFLRVARDVAPDIAPLAEIENSKALTRWAVGAFPYTLRELSDENAFHALKNQLTPSKLGHIVFSLAEDADVKKNQLPLLRLAFSLAPFFKFHFISRDHLPRDDGKRNAGATMVYISSDGKEHRTTANSVKDLSDFEHALDDIFQSHAPVVDQTTYSRICGSKHARKYCLALVDPTRDQIVQVLEQLQVAKTAHEAEQKELESSDDYSRIEPPKIQVISIYSCPAFFSHDFPIGRSFSTWHRQDGILGAKQFLVEESTDRARSVDLNDVSEWYQMLALDDLSLREVGPLKPHLADPFMSVREDLRQVFLGSILRIIAFFLFAVVVVAVLPELRTDQVLLFLAFVPPIVILVTSYILRKSIAITFLSKP